MESLFDERCIGKHGGNHHSSGSRSTNAPFRYLVLDSDRSRRRLNQIDHAALEASGTKIAVMLNRTTPHRIASILTAKRYQHAKLVIVAQAPRFRSSFTRPVAALVDRSRRIAAFFLAPLGPSPADCHPRRSMGIGSRCVIFGKNVSSRTPEPHATQARPGHCA
jgi:hypothetical protein